MFFHCFICLRNTTTFLYNLMKISEILIAHFWVAQEENYKKIFILMKNEWKENFNYHFSSEKKERKISYEMKAMIWFFPFFLLFIVCSLLFYHALHLGWKFEVMMKCEGSSNRDDWSGREKIHNFFS